MSKTILQQRAYRFFSIAVIMFTCFINYSLILKHYNTSINERVLIGKWIYKSKEMGNIIVVFNKNGAGFRMTDSTKIIYKFRYSIIKKSILKLTSGQHKPELHYIKLLTASKMSLRAYPFKKIRESISFFDTDYVKVSSN